jgi:hypothetical protein
VSRVSLSRASPRVAVEALTICFAGCYSANKSMFATLILCF